MFIYTELLLFQNFSVCEDCGTLCGLYHRLHHMKQKLYVMCSEIVEKRKEDSPGIDTTQILNQLLADDVWLETVGAKYSIHFSSSILFQQFKKMQDLWADADCFVLQDQ